MQIKNKLKIEKFFKEQLWQLLIVVAFVCFCAWFFNKPFEAIMFCLAHIVIRQKFDKQYHCGTTCLCLFTTLTILWFGISYLLPMTLSLLSAIPMCFVISMAGYLAQDRIDCKKKLKEYENPNIWTMTDEELIHYCYLKGIRKPQYVQFVVMAVNQLSFREISKKLYVAECTLWDWSEFCRKKLNIKSFKVGRQ